MTNILTKILKVLCQEDTMNALRASEDRICVSEMKKDDLPFLHELWHTGEVMKYADEFPYFRGWSRTDDRESAWKKYQEMRRIVGALYQQLIIRLKDGTRIGESFFAPPSGRKFIGRWKIPENLICIVGDIKVLPQYWGRGLGTEGMRQVVKYAFSITDCDLFVVPPHKDNPAAQRVYEKAGFVQIVGKKGKNMMWAGHNLMKLTRKEFKTLCEDL